MTPLVNRLAKQVLDEGEVDHWSFTALGQNSLFGLTFNLRNADRFAQDEVDQFVKTLPDHAIKVILRNARTTVFCAYRQESLSQATQPREVAAALIMAEIWRLVQVNIRPSDISR